MKQNAITKKTKLQTRNMSGRTRGERERKKTRNMNIIQENIVN